MKLKERVVYRLPNGRELVAHQNGGNGIVLHSLNCSELGQYELNSTGRLLLNGQMTAWEVADLFETGRRASADAILLFDSTAAERDTAHD